MGYEPFKSKTAREAKETVAEVNEYPTVEIPERRISQKTLEIFGIKTALDQTDGVTPVAVYFPYYDEKGKLTGYKKQDLTVDKSEKYHWTTVGKVGISCGLFGSEVVKGTNRKRKTLILTEGEWDALSVYESMLDSVKNTTYEGLQPFVCSIGLGTANAVQHVVQNRDFVTSFSELLLFFDNDSATPQEKKKGIMRGKEAREAVAGALMDGDVALYMSQVDHPYKDASDLKQAGLWREVSKIVMNKRPYSAEAIVSPGDISFEEFIAPRREGVHVKEFPKLMEKIRGFRTKELTIIAGPSGVGKSTLTSIIAHNLIECGNRVAMLFLEEENKETLQRVVAARLKVSFNDFKHNPTACASTEELRREYNRCVEESNPMMIGHFGSMPVEDLISHIKILHLVKKCDFIILDHISLVVSGSEVENERKELDIAMTKLASLCAPYNVGIIVVSHINRGVDMTRPKGLDENETHWVRVTKETMRGSAALEQLSWICLTIEPEILHNGERGRIRWNVEKNRPWGYLGRADEFTLNEDTWEVLLSDNKKTFGF